ncbi:hypothetical protein A2311_03010 [candidate division WOR-1 bacterium RIFOXYB2_FULL_48_7]|uniref:Uncharacterized protein n=1 Tax=candidate division WOR-1 bacterium RIFOXYB2_FULL_48_7 TaxID=1802583 RepID=A0A1F4TJ92_UNCSA|nr:MAG: hypothetical protein A2311_03010 [candidate division WOR-1 bacterium RIFOXYB2_FULL_48_7]
MLKKFGGLLLVVCFLLIGIAAYAEVPATTNLTASSSGTKLQSNIGGLAFGFIKVGSAEVATLAWRPNFKFGPWGLGADVNLALGSNKPAQYESLVLRYVEYDDGKKGLRYGILDNITYGKGLIMKGYSTRKASTVMDVNEQLALKGYVDMETYRLGAMGTRSNIYAARVEELVNPMLVVGEYYIVDTTGRRIVQPDGTTRQFAPVSAIGVDATVPMALNFEGYAEAGQLMNYGNGYAAGLSWAYDLMVANASFLAEYRVLDKGFVPGYFNADYENNPVDLSSAEASGQAKNGYLAQIKVNALGLAGVSLVYESYVNSNATLSGDLFAKLSDQLIVSGYYRQPNFVDYRSVSLENGAVLGADVTYKLNPFTSLITHYKRAYNPATGQVESSQYAELGLNF